MGPARLILGELRRVEAFTFLRAVNTGHPGSMTTIHADTPGRAIERLALLVLQAGSKLARDNVRPNVRESVDVFMHLETKEKSRQVSRTLLALQTISVLTKFVDELLTKGSKLWFPESKTALDRRRRKQGPNGLLTTIQINTRQTVVVSCTYPA